MAAALKKERQSRFVLTVHSVPSAYTCVIGEYATQNHVTSL